MNIKELISKTRSYRRFDESVKIDIKTLTNLVDLARLSASAANRQDSPPMQALEISYRKIREYCISNTLKVACWQWMLTAVPNRQG
jgi:nitroreductase